MSGKGPCIAVFVSPHGFGHAARASAVMEALSRLVPIRFELFSTSPDWFFHCSVPGLYTKHSVTTDVGFVQGSALTTDVRATVEALEEFLPFDPDGVRSLADTVRAAGCAAVLCDISPLGIAVAKQAGVPSVLVENFTWPWLYEAVENDFPALRPLARQLGDWFSRADVHIRAQPYCDSTPGADLVVPPVSRPPRLERMEVRAALGVGPDQPLVVVTMGGFREVLPFTESLRRQRDVHFLVTGAVRTATDGNVHLFGHDETIYMPDFVHACDAVVAKLGYGMVAECWRSGRPLAFVTRADFRETGPLRDWVGRHVPGFEIQGEAFHDGGWIDSLPGLLATEGGPKQAQGGADVVARHIVATVFPGVV